ncbi:MAG: hypothetical protein MJ211_04920 [Bacteroidales bacterium]|nr:hypothetical protein [Bacteroidales bacterium]
MNNFRKTPLSEKSWPYHIFREYAKELQRLDMSFESISDYAKNKLNEEKLEKEKLEKEQMLENSKATYYLYTHNNEELTIEEFYKTFEIFKNWNKLNKIMALNCYFENYIKTLLDLAIKSNPEILKDNRDGIFIIKNRLSYNYTLNEYDKAINKCTKGNWKKRMNSIIEYFKIDDRKFINDWKNDDIIKLFENIRNIRNSVGHSFGRELSSMPNWANTKIDKLKLLSEKEYLEYQKIIKKFVLDLDKFVLNNHIGCFQELYYYHTIKDLDEIKKIKNKKLKAKALSYKLCNEKGRVISWNKCQDLIDYYDSI